MSAWDFYQCKVCGEMFTAERPHDMCEPCYLEILGRAVHPPPHASAGKKA